VSNEPSSNSGMSNGGFWRRKATYLRVGARGHPRRSRARAAASRPAPARGPAAAARGSWARQAEPAARGQEPGAARGPPCSAPRRTGLARRGGAGAGRRTCGPDRPAPGPTRGRTRRRRPASSPWECGAGGVSQPVRGSCGRSERRSLVASSPCPCLAMLRLRCCLARASRV
jgi:hypothetical protein